MASDYETSHDFRRLKLNTSGWQVPPTKHHIESTGIPVPAAQVLGRVGPVSPIATTRIPEEPIREVENGPTNGVDDGCQEARDNSTKEARDNTDRSTSITFNNEVTHDDGNKQSVEKPVRNAQRPRSTRRRSMMHELQQAARDRDRSQDDGDEASGIVKPEARRKTTYRRGEQRWPLLQETADELAEEHVDLKGSTTSLSTMQSTISPQLEGARSPGYFDGEMSLSPSSASSPVQFPSLNDSGVLPSPRIRDLQQPRPVSIRRESRRSSVRSGISGRSPASSFLSRFNRSSSTAPEPDDDGQTIGESGEYIIGRQIGYGGFSVIKEIYSLENNQQMMRAVKIVRRQAPGKDEEENEKLQNEFEHEVSIWRLLQHEHVLPLVAVFSSSHATYCIMEMNTGGTLFDLVRSKRRENSSPTSPCGSRVTDSSVDLARHYLRQLGSALRYLHQDIRIVHRDIKLENCLISTQSTQTDDFTDKKLLLCDFGMADFIEVEGREEPVFDNAYAGHVEQDEDDESHIIGPSDLSTNIAGSLQYASPELIRASKPLHAPAIDTWAFGIVAHALLTADLPFRHSLLPKLQMMILNGQWNPSSLEETCAQHPGAVELVYGCLDMDVAKRWTVSNLVDCRFLDAQHQGFVAKA